MAEFYLTIVFLLIFIIVKEMGQKKTEIYEQNGLMNWKNYIRDMRI